MSNEYSLLLSLIRSDFATADELLADGCDWQEFVWQLCRHKLNTAAYLRASDGLPQEQRTQLEARYQLHLSKVARMNEVIKQLECETAVAGVHFAIVKGFELNDCIYDGLFRDFGDLDILVLPQDADAFHSILNEMGYHQKIGPNSTNVSKSSSARALTALHADKSLKAHKAMARPIKSCPDRPQYFPYVKSDWPTVELHDGFHQLSKDAVGSIINDEIQTSGRRGGCIKLSPEHIFILLLANAYDNSETFYSNSYGFCAVLRDYVDLHYFFEKYQEAAMWERIEKLILKFDLADHARMILGNLAKVYGRDVTGGALRGLGTKDSQWQTSIIDRMNDNELARNKALAVMRTQLLQSSLQSILHVPKAGERVDWHSYYRSASCSEALFNIEHTTDAFVLSWLLPKTLGVREAELLYQFKFYPLTDDVAYTAYKVDCSYYDDELMALGHKTNRQYGGAIKKQTNQPLPLVQSESDGYMSIRIDLPFSELGYSKAPSSHKLCVSADVFVQHFKDIYWRYSEDVPETISLIEFAL